MYLYCTVSSPTLDNVTLLHILQLTCTTNDINVQHMVSYTRMHMPLVRSLVQIVLP